MSFIIHERFCLITLNLCTRTVLLMTLFFFLQLRKPLVEKIHRKRINSSIEQLKSLLGSELLKQQPDSKLEKPDILEMTVCYLRRLHYSRCAQEMTQSQRNLLNHIKQLHTSSVKPRVRLTSLLRATQSRPASPKTTHSPAPSGGRGRNLQTGVKLIKCNDRIGQKLQDSSFFF
uniref:BHLH domain-containing protein n=1 Tax=Astatotilapia calliptera TaxID=8154 RepID=A0A3P8NJX7_ASTCA